MSRANPGAGARARPGSGKEYRMPVSQNETLGDLQRLSDALTAIADDFEHMGGAVTEFQARVAEAQEAATQQAILTSAKQEATQRVQALLKDALAQGALLRKA